VLTHHDLEGLSLPKVLDMLEKGKVGHTAVMDYLHITSIHELVRTMHANGRQMPGHRPMPIRQETLDLLRRISKPLPKTTKTE
jgi:hypothetical protein